MAALPPPAALCLATPALRPHLHGSLLRQAQARLSLWVKIYGLVELPHVLLRGLQQVTGGATLRHGGGGTASRVGRISWATKAGHPAKPARQKVAARVG